MPYPPSATSPTSTLHPKIPLSSQNHDTAFDSGVGGSSEADLTSDYDPALMSDLMTDPETSNINSAQ
jgi:hypothetical protein